jgi:glycosyltransferase involved in cell wall biosynthesis
MQTLHLAQAMISGGCRVTVCCYYEYDDDIVRLFLDAGARTILLRLERSQGNFYLIRKLTVLFRRIKPDIVHVQYMAPGFVPIVAARLGGVRTVFATVHQPGTPYGVKEKFLLRSAAMFCHVFFCVSRETEESWFGDSRMLDQKTGIKPGRKHYTLYNAIDVGQIEAVMKRTDPFALKKALAIQAGPVVGIVGRLREEKGQDVLIRAMSDVKRTFHDASLLVIGDGPDREKLALRARELGVDDHIRWIGQQMPESVFMYYAVMDVAVVPSRFEGFGLAAAEAMAAGLPVVASDVDGLREVVENGATGYLAAPDDSDMLAEKIKYLLSDPVRASEMGRAGRERVARYFSMERFTEAVLNAYRPFIEQ